MHYAEDMCGLMHLNIEYDRRSRTIAYYLHLDCTAKTIVDDEYFLLHHNHFKGLLKWVDYLILVINQISSQFKRWPKTSIWC